jgi:hypothetical protein
MGLFEAMEPHRTKEIHFVSWKKHKVEQTLTQVDSICDSFIDELIFEAITDECRHSYGYPAALPIRQIIQNEPVVPQSPFPMHQLQFEVPEGRRQQLCPVCQATCDAARFTSHLASKCFQNAKPLEVCLRYFEKEEEAAAAPSVE